MKGHTGTYRGHRVLVCLRDGQRIFDRFEKSNSRYIVLVEHGRIERKRIASLVPVGARVAALYGEKP